MFTKALFSSVCLHILVLGGLILFGPPRVSPPQTAAVFELSADSGPESPAPGPAINQKREPGPAAPVVSGAKPIPTRGTVQTSAAFPSVGPGPKATETVTNPLSSESKSSRPGASEGITAPGTHEGVVPPEGKTTAVSGSPNQTPGTALSRHEGEGTGSLVKPEGPPANPGPGGTGTTISVGTGSNGSGAGSGGSDIPDVWPIQRSGPIKPPYPKEAVEKGWEGLVILRALILRNGTVASVTVEQSSGHESLDQAALQTVRRRKYHPALKNGQPVDCYRRIPIRFELTK